MMHLKDCTMKSPKELEDLFSEEIKRRDKLIDELRKENNVLMKTAMRQNEKNMVLMKKIEELTYK